MTRLKTGDRVRFNVYDPSGLVGTVRSWEEKFRAQWKRDRQYFDQWPWYLFWNNIIVYRRHLEEAREDDRLGELVSVRWDGQSEFACDGYVPEVLERIR